MAQNKSSIRQLSSADEVLTDYTADTDAIRDMYDRLDDYEAMLMSEIKATGDFKSRVTDSRIATIAMEGSSRVMATLPSGVVKAMGKKDKGKAMLMDIIRQRYIVPNANAQHNHLVKLRLWNMYSRVYGAMPMIYDWDIRDDYVGPDCWLVPLRNFTPQRGRSSVGDSEYVYVDNYVSPSWLESQIKEKDTNWNKAAVNKVLKREKDSPDTEKEDEKLTRVERNRRQRTGSNEIRIVTRYEAGDDGHWITYAPDHENTVLRDIPNPHESGRIPIVMKYCYPLVDSVLGLGDFERGKTLQFAMDSLVNLYLDSVKMSVYPPTIVNPNGVIPSTIKYGPGNRWLETIPNSIRRYETSPQGLQTFQSTYSFLIGALLNQNGTTDTRQNAESSSDPGFGKTPEALRMLQQRENTRDNLDRFMQEQAVEELYDGMICLVAKQQAAPIEVDVFGEEIEQLEAAGYDDVKEMLDVSESRGYGKLTISNKALEGVDYRFYIEPGSTMEVEDMQQKEAMVELIGMISKVPQLPEMVQASGQTVDVGNLLKKLIHKAGIEDPEQIIYPTPEQDVAQQQEQEMMAQQEQADMAAEEQVAAIEQELAQADELLQQEIQADIDPNMGQMHGNFQDGDIDAIAQNMFGN